MEIQIASDLHLEYYNETNPHLIEPTAPILILAGDIGNLYKHLQLKDFLEKICPKFKAVLYVPGNHEYYTMRDIEPLPFYKLDFRLREIENSIDNLYVLRQTCLKINGIYFIGCTLWSYFIPPRLPPFIIRIKGFNKKKYNELHYRDVAYIKKMIFYCKKNNAPLVVITHHLPTYSVANKKGNDRFRSLYFSNLDYLLKKENIHTWICGHLHTNFDIITPQGTRLVSNQRGKPKDEITNYSKNFTITIE